MNRIHEPGDETIAAAAGILRAGGVVAFPTETVYGLGADTYNAKAIAAVYALKQRPAENPLCALVAAAEQARRLTADWNERCERLAARFWPGPLSLVLPKHDDVPHSATAGLNTIAVRCPRHQVIQSLIEAFGSPISAASANRSGGVSPTLASHVAADFADAPEFMILDGGPCEIGIESTVLDITQDPPRILRVGAVSAAELEQVVGDVREAEADDDTALPGAARPRYAPRSPMELVAPAQLKDRLTVESRRGKRAIVLCFDKREVTPPHQAIEMPRQADEYARLIYEALHNADQTGCDRIIIEQPPESDEMWMVLRSRLEKTAQSRRG